MFIAVIHHTVNLLLEDNVLYMYVTTTLGEVFHRGAQSVNKVSKRVVRAAFSANGH